MGALFMSGELYIIMGLQLSVGTLLLLNRYAALALTLIGPVVVNILLFHIFMDPAGIPVAILITALWAMALLGVRDAFRGILVFRHA